MTDAVITGLGATTPLGGDVASTWAGLLAGRSGAAALTDEWAEPLKARIAARMAQEPTEKIDRVVARKMDRSTQAALVAAREAWADAGLALSENGGAVAPDRLAVVVATGIGGINSLLENEEALRTKGPRRVSPRMIQMIMPNSSAAVISLEFGARAGAITPVSACASGAEAVAHALDLIRLGRADVVIAGGTEACVNQLTMAGFGQAQALSTRNDEPETASRPFDKTRDGFVLGEGSAVLVIERAEFAAARGRTPYARLAGARVTSDAYDMVAPAEEGQVRAMRHALAEAGLSEKDIVHVNAHATSTPTGDGNEARAIHEVFGDAALVCATKSMTGHLLGAAGALEALATVLSVHHGVVPPTPTLNDPDDDLPVEVTRAEARHMEVPAALSNSFGFGGHNTALVFSSV
ncbi:beta-ketoacyl-ACP synthase II [Allokutzneria sp. A3M-2-11 16]|uniref:beta-ketoacyl-[acyl-carrier-protein] synthase family protein n=1 Tax=Allokutzneria sp. A3M-2-11 16 TaxID=2962043 RepID=UPI0020B7C7C2|nr:beta-ketoacyl-ACP synthase II [Allokutzneria sp. A3M-2-11 16]MCP3803932.1 beta-ketoacyl-ACP synthase II [Allokutzneria sp. A3M-2-11 16]